MRRQEVQVSVLPHGLQAEKPVVMKTCFPLQRGALSDLYPGPLLCYLQSTEPPRAGQASKQGSLLLHLKVANVQC